MAKKTHVKVRMVPEAKPDSPLISLLNDCMRLMRE